LAHFLHNYVPYRKCIVVGICILMEDLLGWELRQATLFEGFLFLGLELELPTLMLVCMDVADT
jgi:hypothetical protein